MKRSIRFCIPIILLGSLLFVEAQGIEVQTLLDRPVFFVGQPFHYQVRILYEPSIEFVMERFDQQNFQLEPFQVESLQVHHSREEGFGILAMDMVLVSFEVKTESEEGVWEIPSFPLYYSRDGANVVEVLTVPQTPVAFARTVPENSMRIRDQILYEDRRGAFWLVLLLGCSGIVVAGIPMGLSVYRRLSGETIEVSLERSEIRQQAHQALQGLNSTGLSEDQEILTFYRGLAAILREYCGRLAGKRGAALTAGELKAILGEAGEESGEADRIGQLVALADEVGHSSSGMEAGRARVEEVHREALALLE